MFGCVFYADILGFSDLSDINGAGPAMGALLDVSNVISDNDDLARYIDRDNWLCRYALSDSIFLVSKNAVEACTAAAEIFFRLAFLNASHEDAILMQSVLLRGGISCGDFQEVDPLFPETAKGNLVGNAVVRAVKLERASPTGPRLFISEEVATSLEETDLDGVAWIVDHAGEGPAELLWILPPDPSESNGTMIGDVCDAAVRLFNRYSNRNDKVGIHYAGYLDLVVRSLEKLIERNPEQALFAITRASFERVGSESKSETVKRFISDFDLTGRLRLLQERK